MLFDTNGGLGRRVPEDWTHVDKHRLRAAPTTAVVNHSLKLPDMRRYFAAYDQGQEGACVGFGSSWAMTLLNRVMYSAHTLYTKAQAVDEWADTPPAEGTSVRAAMDVLRTVGHWRLVYDRKANEHVILPADVEHGIEANKWATTVDEARTCISQNVPVVTGFNWYENFNHPTWDPKTKRWWIGKGELGRVRGGHCTCHFAALDKYDAFAMLNNWGAPVIASDHTLVEGYPVVLMPYETFERLLREDGEVTVITDRVGAPRTAPWIRWPLL